MTSARVVNRNHMSSFYFRTIGCLDHNPELVTSDEGSFYRFCLTGHDYTEDDQGQFKVEFQSLWFDTSQTIGALIAMGASKGDQLIVEGRIHKHRWSEKGHHSTSFVVTAFQFGARGPASPVTSAAISRIDSPPERDGSRAAAVAE
jgi:hypothetical protein